MAKGKRETQGKSKTKVQEDGQAGFVAGAIQVAGSVIGAAAAVTDFIATQVTGAPLLVQPENPKHARATKKASNSKAGGKKESARKTATKIDSLAKGVTAKNSSQAASGAKKGATAKTQVKKSGGKKETGKAGEFVRRLRQS